MQLLTLYPSPWVTLSHPVGPPMCSALYVELTVHSGLSMPCALFNVVATSGSCQAHGVLDSLHCRSSLISDFMLQRSPSVCSSYRARASFTGKWAWLFFPSPRLPQLLPSCLFLQLLLKLESVVGEEFSSTNLGMCSARQHRPLPWQSLGSCLWW